MDQKMGMIEFSELFQGDIESFSNSRKFLILTLLIFAQFEREGTFFHQRLCYCSEALLPDFARHVLRDADDEAIPWVSLPEKIQRMSSDGFGAGHMKA